MSDSERSVLHRVEFKGYLISKANVYDEWAEGPDFVVIPWDDTVAEAFWQRVEDAVFVSECLKPAPDYLEWYDGHAYWVRGYTALEEHDYETFEDYDFAQALVDTNLVFTRNIPRVWLNVVENMHGEPAGEVRTDGDRLVTHTRAPYEVWITANLKHTSVEVATEMIDLRSVKTIPVFEGKKINEEAA